MTSNSEVSHSSSSSSSSFSSSTANTIDRSKLEEFMMKAVGDMASSLGAMMIILGDRLGLYKAMAKSGPITSEELSTQTNTAERYIREWLASQAAAGYITFNSKDKTFSLSPENAMVLANEDSPAFILGSIKFCVRYLKMKINLLKYSKVEKGFVGANIIMIFLKEQRNFSNQII